MKKNRNHKDISFDEICDRALSRREFLGGTVAFSTAAFVMGTTALTPLRSRAEQRLMFNPVPANTLDTVTVPDGYSWHITAAWGDPLWSDAPSFDP